MQFEIWSDGDRSVGIRGGSARVTIDGLEFEDAEFIGEVTKQLQETFANIFDDNPGHIIDATEYYIENSSD